MYQAFFLWRLISELLDFSWYLDHGPYRFLVKFLMLYWALCLELCSRAGKQDMAVGNVLVSSFLLGFSSSQYKKKRKKKGGGEEE